MDTYVIGHVRAVLSDRVIDDARIAASGGRILEAGHHPPGSRADVDGRGLLCLPALVDVHTDVLARECRPRPGATLPMDFALTSAEGRLLAAGITTAFHGAAFQERSAVGIPIGSPGAEEIVRAVAAARPGAVDHRVLHRCDIRCPAGVTELRRTLSRDPLPSSPEPLLVSHEDHTPGQGQYADPAAMRRWLVEAESMTPSRAATHVERLRADRDERLALRDETLAWLGSLAAHGRIRLAGHDPATPGDIEALAARGGSVAEFPTTITAAQAAREAGLHIVAGAPNALRGGSHSGNVSVAELAAQGLVDALASDYLPSALLAAPLVLVREGLTSLSAAIGMVTSGPAAAARLADRGRLAPGQRADLLLADVSGRWPRIVRVLTSGLGAAIGGPDSFEGGGRGLPCGTASAACRALMRTGSDRPRAASPWPSARPVP